MQKDNPLKRLNRAQLLDMLYDEVKEKEDLEQKLQETRQQLEDRKILIAKSGSIAEAALKLNKVFEQAQEAADQYLFNIRQGNDLNNARAEDTDGEERTEQEPGEQSDGRERRPEEEKKSPKQEDQEENNAAGCGDSDGEDAYAGCADSDGEDVYAGCADSDGEDVYAGYTDAEWTVIRYSEDERKEDARIKLVQKLVQGEKVIQSEDSTNIFRTAEGTALFLKETGDKESLAYATVPLDKILKEYYRKLLSREDSQEKV